MPIRAKDWTKVDGTIPNVRLIESERVVYRFSRWRYILALGIGIIAGQITHWIF